MKQAWAGMILTGWVFVAASAQTTVHFTIDPTRDIHPISRLIYGINQPIGGEWANLTFIRMGGNRMTAYNWVTNASNAGSDWKYSNDAFLGGGDTPGGATIPTLQNAFDHNAAALITIPINGFVSADKDGPVDIHDPNRFKTRFEPEAPAKGAPFTLQPDPNSPTVFEDEYVNWVKTKFPQGQTDPNRRIYFQLDNEPDIWSATHAEVHPNKLTYAELVQKNIAYAKAIKNVAPAALVYGPVSFGWSGFHNLQDAPDANGRDFIDFYLRQMSGAEATAGKRLLDALDIHWYPEATGGGKRITLPDSFSAIVAARLQAPRSLWDPTYVEASWITNNAIHEPIRLIPRFLQKIAKNYPGAKLSISEYNYGGGEDISGAIAQADVLGIFGKYGVFSANEWPLSDKEPAIAAGFAMYRNFDGHNATFGDTSIWARTDDVVKTSVYASVDSSNPDRMVIIAINKADRPITAEIRLNNWKTPAAEVYRLGGSNFKPLEVGGVKQNNQNGFQIEMPAFSVSSIVIKGL